MSITMVNEKRGDFPQMAVRLAEVFGLIGAAAS
jgi:plasmid maintenance system antidote protein VapI